jgi:hypothetical protein
MKEVRSRKTGMVDFMTDEQYEVFKKRSFAKNFTVTEVTPIKQIIPKLDIVTVSKKVTKKKVNET